MKPYPNYKGNKLKDIDPTAIALVTEGANRRKFCLFKLNQGEVSMKKETALTLIKAGKLSYDEAKLVVESVADADRAEVQKAADALKTSETAVDVEKLATAIAEKINKVNEAKLTAIADSLKTTVTVLEKLAGNNVAEDKELSDAEAQALITAEMEKE